MNKAELSARLDEWLMEMRLQEYAKSSLMNYRNRVQKFIDWLPEEQEISKEMVIQYKEYLRDESVKANTLNAWIVAVNKYLRWLGHGDMTVKKIKTQMQQSNEEVLSITDYKRLLRIAKRDGDMNLYYIMKILAMTGIRIIELKYFTVENLQSNYISVYNKGKDRRVILRQDLLRELKHYAQEQGIKEGYLFPSPIVEGKMLNPSTIWRHMKKTAGRGRVKKSKVHPHSFRHLFAQVYLETYTDSVTELADILGHSSLETTRLYTRTSDAQKKAKLERMKF